MTRSLPLLRFSLFTLALAFAAGGCATQVSVDPQTGGPIATYDDGTLKGIVNSQPMAVFDAANKALDEQGYFRAGQRLNKDQSDIEIIARAVQDYKVVVHITTGKEPGTSNLAVSFGDGNLPKSQAIYAGIVKRLGQSGPASPAPAGFSSPSRPSGN